MIPPPNDPDEARRLSVLRQYAVLDTPPEAALDDLTALAAEICGTPISLISLVDGERQWFKSHFGLEVAETPREQSFCSYALRQSETFEVPDATRDPRFERNPLVTGEPGIRFYAGNPLVTPEGVVLGTLCVIDRVARTLTPAQDRALGVLKRQVMAQLELRRQTREVAERERLLRAIFDSEPECVKLLGPDGALRLMNRAGLAMIEAESFAQVEGKALPLLIAADHRTAFAEMSRRVFGGEVATLEFEIVGLKGTRRWMEMHAAPLRDERGAVTDLLGVTRDITERRGAMEALSQSEARFASVFRSSPAAIGINTMHTGRIIDVNARLCTVLGWRREEMVGKTVFELGVWVDLAQREPLVAKMREAGAVQDAQVQLRRRDGAVIEVMMSMEMVDMPGESETVLVVMFADVTERQQAEKALRESEARLLAAQEVAKVGSWETDLADLAVTWSAETFRIFETTPEEFRPTHRGFLEFVHPDDRAAVDRAFVASQRERTAHKIEHRLLMRDGRVKFVEERWRAIHDAHGRPIRALGTCQDITERRQLEQQFLRAQRMESIGTLAGGIAHDLNNVLGPIILSLDLLKMRCSDAESVELIDLLGASAERGADMVKQVLSFARGVEGRRMEVQVQHLVGDIEKIANETFLKNIQITTRLPGDLWTITGDPTQLHQLLLNLCLNARDAMPAGGSLLIAAENRMLDAQYAGQEAGAQPGPYVFIEVEDTGSGIPAENLERIFDPFFTTKEVGKGTGLGLSTSLAIVKGHGGFIRVYSELGRGTKFKVYLPASAAGTAERGTVPEPEMPRGQGEVILVVDDEPSVRQTTRQTLAAFGYRVLLASDGADALAVYASRRDEIAVVLTDMMMPVMDGPATIRVLRKMNPALPIIAASGLATNGHVAALGVQHFLPKPYTAETLLGVLKEVLAGKS